MRDIEFRGKCVETGDWMYGDLVHYDEVYYIHTKATYGLYKNYRADPSTVGESTGIVDGDGTKVYEGDIIQQDATRISGMDFEGFHAVVGFNLGQFAMARVGLYVHCLKEGQAIPFVEPFDTNSPSTFRVIGNVWDNPELLPEYVPELLTEATT